MYFFYLILFATACTKSEEYEGAKYPPIAARTACPIITPYPSGYTILFRRTNVHT